MTKDITLTKKIFFTLTLMLIGMCVALGCLEILARAYQFYKKDSRSIISHPVLHHAWKPNARLWDNRNQDPYYFNTNEQGWIEDYSISKKKDNNTIRIFFIGDSNTQSVVEKPYKMSELVEQKLQTLYPNKKFEVINTGTSSYSSLIYYVLIKEYLLSYSPDLLIINYDMTDVVNDSLYKNFVVKDEHNEIQAIPDLSETLSYDYIMTPTGIIEIKRSRLYKMLQQYSSLFYYIDKIASRLYLNPENLKKQATNNANWLKHTWNEAIQDSVNYSMNILKKTIDLTKNHNVPLLIASVPHYTQFTGTHSIKPIETLDNTITNHNGSFINTHKFILDNFSKEEHASLYWDFDYTHLNKKGNRVFADIHTDHIIKQLNLNAAN